jgi:phosphoenolpyruvate-protein phosphotransferase
MTQLARDDVEGERGPAVLTGVGVSPGSAEGTAWLVVDLLKAGARGRRIARNEIAAEWTRLRTAFDDTRRELGDAAVRVEDQFDAALAGIFRAHAMMLDGILASGELERELGSLVDAEEAVRNVFRRWYEKFLSLKAPTFQQRADDVADLGRRVIRRLQGREDGASFAHVPAGSVLVLERLLPSDVVALSRRGIAAVVVESIAPGSHAALLAREKRIPVVAGPPGVVRRLRTGDELLVDGHHGAVVVAPDAEARLAFQARLETYQRAVIQCRGACREPAFTLDRERVWVEANLGAHDDAALALENGADGIGLFRIEQLYLARAIPPTEEELFEELRTVTAPLRGAPITIRLLDVGGDKPLPFLPLPAETNPSLGRRGVRLLLEYPQLVRTQLGALLRLSLEQDVRILVPMITLEEDIRAIRALFDAALVTLAVEKRPPLGAMIETPAAALGVPAIARHVDFLSVGTNDLTQYTLAAGRDDPAVSRYYVDTHAAVLRLLAITIAEAGSMPISVCGELAGREVLIPELLRLGVRSLSMAPELIPAAKEVIRGVRIGKGAGADAIRA